MAKKKDGATLFDEFYSEIYSDRWPKVKEALFELDKKVARKNLFYPQADFESIDLPGLGKQCDGIPNSFEISEGFDLAQLETQQLPFYRMDPASLYPALALRVEPGESVLDMCAAPGGKSLILMEELARAATGDFDTSGSFLANELSPKRRHRMMTVFKRYLPKDIRQMIRIKGMDASRIGLERKEAFDRILLDAPCSGERGLVHKKSDLANWKPKRTKSFGIRQYALLSSALMALKPSGRIVYSTCSISPYENDEVIRKLIKRHGEKVKIMKNPFEVGEETEFGTQFLPDRAGWGPIYFSIIEKL